MSRRDRAPERKVRPDSVYNDVMVTKFINSIMKDGKKHLAEKIFYNALDLIEKKTKEKGIDVFKRAIENIQPSVEVRSRKIGGATYQVPVEVRPKRVNSLSLKWLTKYSRDRKDHGMVNKLANEIIEASRSEGKSVGKKVEIHKVAEANRAFAHYKF